jgi:hypothetical protein
MKEDCKTGAVDFHGNVHGNRLHLLGITAISEVAFNLSLLVQGL